MKKIFIYAMLGAVVAGTVHLVNHLNDKEKMRNCDDDAENKKEFEHSSELTSEEIAQNEDVVNVEEEMYYTKNEKAQSVQERHIEAVEIMRTVYSDVMEDFVEDFSRDNLEQEVAPSESLVNHESVGRLSKMDSISDELDNLLG